MLRAGPRAILSHQTATEADSLIDVRGKLIHVTWLSDVADGQTKAPGGPWWPARGASAGGDADALG